MTNGFKDIGFLNDDFNQWRDSVHAKFPRSFAFADRMNRMGMCMIHEFPEGDSPIAQVFSICGFYFALQSFQTAILLAERGALAQARALTRLCCEATIVTGSLLRDEKTFKELCEDRDKSRLSSANIMMERFCKEGEQFGEFQKIINDINNKYLNKEKPRSVKFDQLAERAGLSELYQLAYRNMSGNAAHAGLDSFTRHFDGSNGRLFFQPDESDLGSTLLAANGSLLHLFDLAVGAEQMKLGHYKTDICAIWEQWKKYVCPELGYPEENGAQH